MRKELIVYVSTTERGEEISVTAVAKNRDFVLINMPSGKFTANRVELIEALNAIEAFDKVNNTEQAPPVEVSGNDIEYGDE